MRGMRLFIMAGLALGPAAAYASDQGGTTPDQWKEEFSGGINGATDAGQTLPTANLTRGAGPLNRITGTFQFTRDVDMYCIYISDPANFSAGFSGGTDTNLALFDTLGRGIAFNDNNPAGGNAGKLSNAFTAALAPGLFYLAANRNDSFGGIYNYPLDAGNNPIFNALGNPPPNRNVEYGPNNPAATLDHYSYQITGFEGFNSNYTINLTGASYHQLPAPSAAALLGLGGLMAARRRR